MTSVVNVTKDLVLAHNVDVARSFIQRLRGLIGRRGWANIDGLWIEPCTGVHALGMRFPIDVVLVDESLTVLWIQSNLRPWRLGRVHLDSRAALELPQGSVTKTGTDVGDVLDLRSSVYTSTNIVNDEVDAHMGRR